MNSRRSPWRAVGALTVALVVAVLAVFAVQQAVAQGSSDPMLSEADGSTRSGPRPEVFDEEHPTVVNLDPDLLAALRRAGTDAAHDAVRIEVTSGWRSEALQAALLADAVTEYGSEEEAARWVATPETSAHVSGDAVDLWPSSAQEWLARHGARYGLCQTYANEPWHYELRPEAVDDGCPQMFADPTDDPRINP